MSNEMTVRVFQDGDEVCALIGIDLQVGTSGFGRTASDALRALADALESESQTQVQMSKRAA